MNQEPIRILFVEDNPADRRAFELFVRDEGQPYSVEYSGSVEDAKRALAAAEFDVIVSDFRLHDGTALDFFDRVRGVPIVVMTGAGDERIAVRALQAGAADYLIKDTENRHLQTLPVSIRNAISGRKTRLSWRITA
jgi:DNA-binding NtrC family response regulator